MSTKCSIKWSQEKPGEPGFHLYSDAMEDLTCEGTPSIYLELTGVHVEMQTLNRAGAVVTVEIPQNIAIDLGLIKSSDTLNLDEFEHKPKVEELMNLARKFRSASGEDYDACFKALQDACSSALLK